MRFFVCLLFAVFTVTAGARELPPGWRAPTRTEQSLPKDDWRSDSVTRFLVARGNFFGSSLRTEARLLVREDGKEAGVHVRAATGQWIAVLLLSVNDLRTAGLSTLSAGTYRTACGKGYWPCEAGEPDKIQLKHSALVFFAPEGASSVFIWSLASRSFVQVWLSD